MDEEAFWNRVRAVAKRASRAYLATVENSGPRVRVVFPAFEGAKLWIATKPGSAKARQIRRDPGVELFYEVGANPKAEHLTIRGEARFIDDADEKQRIWNARIFGYDLSRFWPEGPQSADFGLLLVTPHRVELGTQPGLWQGQPPEVWRA
jgi:general stress protein 26